MMHVNKSAFKASAAYLRAKLLPRPGHLARSVCGETSPSTACTPAAALQACCCFATHSAASCIGLGVFAKRVKELHEMPATGLKFLLLLFLLREEIDLPLHALCDLLIFLLCLLLQLHRG